MTFTYAIDWYARRFHQTHRSKGFREGQSPGLILTCHIPSIRIALNLLVIEVRNNTDAYPPQCEALQPQPVRQRAPDHSLSRALGSRHSFGQNEEADYRPWLTPWMDHHVLDPVAGLGAAGDEIGGTRWQIGTDRREEFNMNEIHAPRIGAQESLHNRRRRPINAVA